MHYSDTPATLVAKDKITSPRPSKEDLYADDVLKLFLPKNAKVVEHWRISF